MMPAMRPRRVFAVLAGVTVSAWLPLDAQDQLRGMPGYARYQRMAREIPASVVFARPDVTWISGTSFEFTRGATRVRYDAEARREEVVGRAVPPRTDRAAAVPRQDAPLRSPDRRLQAFVRDGHVWLADGTGGNARRVTADGGTGQRRNGEPPDLYRSELNQATGLWWSPGSRRLAFYRVAGPAAPTPVTPGAVVDVQVYDVASRRVTTLDVRGGRPPGSDVPGYYAYRIQWSGNDRDIRLLRMNRQQNVLELATCSADDGRCRAIVREASSSGSVDAQPEMVASGDGERFVWSSERSGFRNLYLYGWNGSLLTTLTTHRADVGQVMPIVPSPPTVFYMVADGDTPAKPQLHRVGLDGRDERRLTDPARHHTTSVSPDGRFVVDVAEDHDHAPVARLLDRDGRAIAVLAESDTTRFDALGLKRVEAFSFPASDGSTTLHGVLHVPSSFDPTRRHPLLVRAYAGPGTNAAAETFTLPDRLTELGFLVAAFESRGGPGRGRLFRDALYQRLGTLEVDDQAAGVRALLRRPYVDGGRVGIFGTSYGGYVAAMGVLRHGDVFRAAASSSAVTDWRHYNAVYAERHLGLVAGNDAAYSRAGLLPLAPSLTRPLLLYYGTADPNVRPTHTQRLVEALRAAGRTLTLDVGVNRGHTSVDEDTLMRFFIDALDVQGIGGGG
jgi:dipeptidyl-peptidase 4